MLKRQPIGVKEMAVYSKRLPIARRVPAIRRVADNGMADVRKMNPDLMSAPRFKRYLDERARKRLRISSGIRNSQSLPAMCTDGQAGAIRNLIEILVLGTEAFEDAIVSDGFSSSQVPDGHFLAVFYMAAERRVDRS